MYDSSQTYELCYHYMHYYPGDTVIIRMQGNLVQKTLDLLKNDTTVIIDYIKDIDE